MRELAVVIPVYNEAEQIARTVAAVEAALGGCADLRYRFLLVDDGSEDGSWRAISELADGKPHLRGVRLSRNFGKEAALCAGLDLAEGVSCLIMDADLQHPPDVLPRMVALWREGYDVVEGVKISRGKESLSYRLLAGSFYWILERLSGFSFENGSDFKLLDAKVVAAWKRMGESRTFFRGMSAWLGFRRATVPFAVGERGAGRSGWSAFKLIRLAVDAIASFTSAPLHVVTILGFFFFLFAGVLGAQTLVNKVRGLAVDGFTTVILLQLLIGSILMMSLGIIGIYIARIFDEVKHRPRYVIAEATASTGKDFGEPD